MKFSTNVVKKVLNKLANSSDTAIYDQIKKMKRLKKQQKGLKYNFERKGEFKEHDCVLPSGRMGTFKQPQTISKRENLDSAEIVYQ